MDCCDVELGVILSESTTPKILSTAAKLDISGVVEHCKLISRSSKGRGHDGTCEFHAEGTSASLARFVTEEVVVIGGQSMSAS